MPVDLTAWPRVQMLLANANGRIIFGRGPEKANQALKRHEIAMNEMAGKVHSARPHILGWEVARGAAAVDSKRHGRQGGV